MRVSVNQQNLAKALGITGRAVSSRTTMPVLSNILLEAKNNQLRLAATNREIGINCWIGAKVEDEGAITIPARLLTEFVNSLPPERIDMELTVRTQTMHLSCARFEANMKGIDAFEFPVLPTMEVMTTRPDNAPADWAPGVQVALDATVLGEMIGQVIFAASTDENRPTLTGVEVTLASNRLQMAATDGYRLSVRSAIIEGGPAEQQVAIVPARSLATLGAVVDDGAPVAVLLTQNRNQVMFAGVAKDTLGVEMISELIDARFPDYRATIPKSHTTRTTVDTAALLKAVRVALLFARGNANTVRFTMTPDNENADDAMLSMVATDAEMGDNISELHAEVDGDGITIALNAKYCIDVLSQITQPKVVIETTTPTRPAKIYPAGVGEDVFTHCVMPLHPPREGQSQ